MTHHKNLVSVKWLKMNYNLKNIKILDASWYLPGIKRDPEKEFRKQHIPNSIHFNIEKVSDKESKLPHMLPKKEKFSQIISNMGIGNEDHIVIYSYDGISTSPRVWWMFKYFGHNKVSILNGGLKEWIKLKGSISSEIFFTKFKKFTVKKIQKNLCSDMHEISKLSKNKNKKVVILDARPQSRFLGLEKEPRKEIRKGHIPNSINIPAEDFLNNGNPSFLQLAN